MTRELATLKLRSRYSSEDDPVFAARNGKPLKHRNATRRGFEAAAAKAGIEGVTFHSMRHRRRRAREEDVHRGRGLEVDASEFSFRFCKFFCCTESLAPRGTPSTRPALDRLRLQPSAIPAPMW